MRDVKMMACGHAANAFDSKTKAPVCVICNSTKVVEGPNLEGRKATCCYGNHAAVDSKLTLAFFLHQPQKEHDQYYCGCMGWD